MATTANRGKWAEARVHDYLEAKSNRMAEFDYERMPDARAAMGRFKSMIGDFEFFRPGDHGVIEAKETKHNTRISKDKLKQLPRLHKRTMCGGTCIVVIYHTETKLWRAFTADKLKIGQASWDLSKFQTFETLDGALNQFRVMW
jgi:hypothetical protein